MTLADGPDFTLETLIDGELIDPAGDPLEPIRNPADGTAIAQLKAVSAEQMDRACKAARRSFDEGTWRSQPVEERSRKLLGVADAVRAASEELAVLEAKNVGKPIAQARDDALGVADAFEYYAKVIIDRPGEVLEEPTTLTVVTREPVGVVTAIIPWNYPLAIAGLHIATALAAGCSLLLKPSELTPLTAMKLGEIVGQHVASGVINILPGPGPTTGQALATAEEVDLVLFTGGTKTGARVASLAGERNIPVRLELGGKSPVVVFDDAPLDLAAPHALARITLNQGENCGAGSRLLVHERIRDRLLERMCSLAAGVTIGDPLDPGTELGPMITEAHRRKVLSYVDGDNADGSVLFRGHIPTDSPLDNGYFAPLVLSLAGPGSRTWRDEIFGPVLAIHTFTTDDEAVSLANDTPYGLQATVWSGDRGRALAAARQIRAGVVRVNASIPPPHAPWGGFKSSGDGRIQGRYGLDELTRPKAITIPT